MIVVLLRRLLWAVPLFICVTFLIFSLFELAPTALPTSHDARDDRC